MELLSVLSMMQACNTDATLELKTNCDHEVELSWHFMGISHSVKHLKVRHIEMDNIKFQRSLHVARTVMRCRMHLRKLYQKYPKMHAQVMSGALR